MNTLDAAHQLAREYPGGLDILATRLGKSPFTLRHELTRQGSAKFALSDAEAATEFALAVKMPNPLRILQSFAQNVGARVIVLPEIAEGQDDTLKGLAEAASAFSQFVNSVAMAVADGKVTANELQEVDRRLSALVGHSTAVQALLAAIHNAAKPQAQDSSTKA